MPTKRTPSKGKRFVKVVKNKKTGRTKKVSYGQAGKSKSGKDRIQAGTPKGDSYCARSAGIKKRVSAKNETTRTPQTICHERNGDAGVRKACVEVVLGIYLY